jgi:hypothetical protein
LRLKLLRYFILLLALFTAKQSLADVNFCSLSTSKQKALIECSENYNFHQCDQLINNGVDKKLINSCDNPNEISSANSLSEAAEFCGSGIKEAVKGIPQSAANFKDWMFLEGKHDANTKEYEGCNKDRSDEPSMWDSLKWSLCIRGQQTNKAYMQTKAFALDENGVRTEALETIFRSAHCYKKEAYAKTICPMIGEFVVGMFTGPALSAAKNIGSSGLKVRAKLRRVSAESDHYLSQINKSALSESEKKSVLHQSDLLDATKNPALASIIDKAGLDMKALHGGMLDSDAGKIQKFMQSRLMEPSPESDELFSSLKGQGKAGEAISEALSSNGIKNPTLLNPKLSNAEIRSVFNESPSLRSYMHEMPGMETAIRQYNAGLLTKEEFQKRILANFGHNGPHEGFWQEFSERILPPSLKSENAKKFFSNTPFEGAKNTEGVVTPRYPSPITAEGVFHTTMDRLSQGTAGGMDKIFSELGGNVYKVKPNIPLSEIGFPPNKGLGILNELFIGSPEKTLRQLNALKTDTAKLNTLSPTQQSELNKLIGLSEDRINTQTKFIKNNVHIKLAPDGKTIQNILIKEKDEKGITVWQRIDSTTPADDAHKIMNSLMEREQEVNGRAIADLGKKPPAAQKLVTLNRVPAYSLMKCGQTIVPHTNQELTSGTH